MVTHRDDILGAAQRLLNVDAGASMTAIAEAAGVGRATLHRHFTTREALLTELGTRSLDRWEGRLDDGDLEAVAASGDAARIRSLLDALVLGYVEDSDDFGFALTDHVILADEALVERTERLADRETVLWAAGQSAGVLRADLAPRWLGHAVYGLLVAAREAVRVGDVARRDVPDLVLSTFLTGVGER
jgi:AcrR family transcriptional regulator